MGQILLVNRLHQDIYKEDEIRFNLLSLAASHETARIFTDQKHIIVCQVNMKTPIWLWTHAQVTENELVTLKECLYSNYPWKTYTTLMIKPELLSVAQLAFETMLHEKSSIITKIMSYGFCPGNYAFEKRGHMEKANDSMIDRIAKLRAYNINETERQGVYEKDLQKEAAWMVKTGDAYVWMDSIGKLVSLAYIAHRSLHQARINRVYTHPDQRGKGYASMLMHELSSLIYEEGRIAMVYADATYPPANATYIKSGFVEHGLLYEIGIK